MTKKNVSTKKITMIEPVDMSKPMFGNGIATVVASAIRVMGDNLILVGLSSDEAVQPVGKWTKTTLFGKTCDFFPVMSVNDLNRKYIKNLSFAIRLIRFWPRIIKKTSHIVVTQNYLVMWVIAWSKKFIQKSFYYPGLGNQMLIGRKPRLGKLLHKLYNALNFYHLSKMDLIFAAASIKEILGYQNRWHYKLKGKKIYQLPTSVNVELFSPKPELCLLKNKYSLDSNVSYFVCVGRLARVKGIDFLIDVLLTYNEKFGPATLLLVGDGEDRYSLEVYIKAQGLEKSVIFFGNKTPVEVSEIINCADVCIVGSTFEGFSCAMVEQIACGKPLVSTAVSGAAEIINEGVNGFIVNERDPEKFATSINDVLHLDGAGMHSREIAIANFSEKVIWSKFQKLVKDNLDNVASLA